MNPADLENEDGPASGPGPIDRVIPPGASWFREPEADRTIEENWLLTLRRERFRSRASEKVHDYYVIHLADAVHVIALTPDRRLVLVEQFRAGSGRDSLETPGGLLNPGEDPLAAGARELLEETGYAGDPPILLGTVWSNPSLLTSRITTILVTNARKVAEPQMDENEEVRVQLVPAREIPQLLRNGRINHALVVSGLLWWLVAELPGNPLELADSPASRPRQFRIGTGMMVIAVVGVALAIVARAGLAGALLLGLLAALGGLFASGSWIAEASRKSVLETQMRMTRRGLVRELLYVFGLLIVWMVLLFVIVGTVGSLGDALGLTW